MSGGVISASIQLNAADIAVTIWMDEHTQPHDDRWFLSLATTDGWATISGTLEELRQLANMIADRVNGA